MGVLTLLFLELVEGVNENCGSTSCSLLTQCVIVICIIICIGGTLGNYYLLEARSQVNAWCLLVKSG